MSKGTFNREEYERVSQRTDDDDPEVGPHPSHYYLNLAKKLLWITIGLASILHTRLHDHVLNWQTDLAPSPSFYILAGSVVLSAGLMLYLVLVVKRKHGPMALRRWRTFAPGAVQTLTGANVVAFVAAVKLFHQFYGWKVYIIVPVLSWAWLNLLTFV